MLSSCAEDVELSSLQLLQQSSMGVGAQCNEHVMFCCFLHNVRVIAPVTKQFIRRPLTFEDSCIKASVVMMAAKRV